MTIETEAEPRETGSKRNKIYVSLDHILTVKNDLNGRLVFTQILAYST